MSMVEPPARYCGNCGNELNPADQFCQNCGTPVHQAATVPTPEADVPVPHHRRSLEVESQRPQGDQRKDNQRCSEPSTPSP